MLYVYYSITIHTRLRHAGSNTHSYQFTTLSEDLHERLACDCIKREGCNVILKWYDGPVSIVKSIKIYKHKVSKTVWISTGHIMKYLPNLLEKSAELSTTTHETQLVSSMK